MNKTNIIDAINNYRSCLEEILRIAFVYKDFSDCKHRECDDLARLSYVDIESIRSVEVCEEVLEIEAGLYFRGEYETEIYDIPFKYFGMTDAEIKRDIEEYDKKTRAMLEKQWEDTKRFEAEKKAKQEEEDKKKRYEEYCKLKEEFETPEAQTDAQYIIGCVNKGILLDLNQPNKAGLETTIIKP